MPTDTHRCPGCGKAGIARSRLACPPCWFRLPKDLRDAVRDGWKVRAVYPARHLAAVSDALDWYRRDRRDQKRETQPPVVIQSVAPRRPRPDMRNPHRHD